MIPYTTLHAFHDDDDDMLPSSFTKHLFQNDPCEDSATFDLDTLFPDEQLDKAEYIEDFKENIHYAKDFKENIHYAKDFKENIHYAKDFKENNYAKDFKENNIHHATDFKENNNHYAEDFKENKIHYGEDFKASYYERMYYVEADEFNLSENSDSESGNLDYIGVFVDDIHYGDTPEDAYTPSKKYYYKNCKWTGCDEECAKSHYADIPSDPFSDMELSLDQATVIKPNLLFGYNANSDDDTCDEAYITDAGSPQPYTPDSDHCYSQPMHMRVVSEESDRTIQDSVDSESTSETSDDEVDVVTVTEEYVRPVQRYVEKPHKPPKRKYTSRKNSRTRNSCSVSVKAAATAIKRTRYQNRGPAKRRKTNSVETSPSSSLPSSSCNSRCNSDIEDYEKRSTHNDSERKRREAQRTALQMLRVCIPELQSNSKAPKVLILNTATNLVKKLEREAVGMKEQLQNELKRRKRLQERLKQLTTAWQK